MTSPDGRQVTVRYAREADVLRIAVIVGGPANVAVQTIIDSSLFSIDARRLTAAARRDARVAWALAEELNRRLCDTLQQTAINTFGSVRQREAAALLDLASAQQRPQGRLMAPVSQQELADQSGRSGRSWPARTATSVSRAWWPRKWRSANRRRLLMVTSVAGIGYALSWIAGLSVPSPSPKLTAPAAALAAALAGHGTAVAAQFALTGGAARRRAGHRLDRPGRGARRSGAAGAARVALFAGGGAALISLLQFVLGAVLAGTTAPGTARMLYDAVNRLDGVKMLALAILGLAGAASGVLPRWLRYTGIALAITITGITLGTSTNQPSREVPAVRKAAADSGALRPTGGAVRS
jgi:hypothetical protein